jgi:hypothetical protein
MRLQPRLGTAIIIVTTTIMLTIPTITVITTLTTLTTIIIIAIITGTTGISAQFFSALHRCGERATAVLATKRVRQFATLAATFAPHCAWGSKIMPIRPFLASQVFEPELILQMSLALESVCETLELSFTDDPATRLVASKIIELAQRGVRDAPTLSAMTLKEFKDYWLAFSKRSHRALHMAQGHHLDRRALKLIQIMPAIKSAQPNTALTKSR